MEFYFNWVYSVQGCSAYKKEEEDKEEHLKDEEKVQRRSQRKTFYMQGIPKPPAVLANKCDMNLLIAFNMVKPCNKVELE